MKPTDNLDNKIANNPYHVSQIVSGSEAPGAIGALRHEVDDLVKLELTAEQMVGEEVDLAKAYIREDAQGFWGDMKLGLTELEVMTGDWLLQAADPTRVEWRLNNWWEDDESQFRH